MKSTKLVFGVGINDSDYVTNTNKGGVRCCYQEQVVLWRNQEMNETLKDYVDTYISPVKMYYLSMDDQMEVWGTRILPEDLIDE